MSENKKYRIEHKILTLSQCAVMDSGKKPASFEVEGVEFSHWEFNYREGWKADAWIASSEIQSKKFIDAINIFRKKLSKLIPRISLICQSYIKFVSEPFLIHETSKNVVFFKYIKDVKPVGLMFMKKEQKALNKLLKRTDIPDEFFYYWNDTVNAVGYSAKLLLMFSAIEALVKRNGQKDWELINEILGEKLVEEFFGTIQQPNSGLRHRLVHGEYFDNRDNKKDYLEQMHNKIINYFNEKIFSESLIRNVVHPQRHFFGNKKVCKWFIKKEDGSNLFSLKNLLNDFNKNGLNPKKHKIVFDDSLIKKY